jgi:chemotaxis protein CheX
MSKSTARSPEILIASHSQVEAAGKFQDYVRSQGRSAGLVNLDDNPSPDVGGKTKGVVLFDDGELPLTDWLRRILQCTRYLAVPLVVVPARADDELKSRLLAAGATAVCKAGDPDERVLSELDRHCDIQPVLAELRQELLDPFISATQVCLREMTGTDAKVRSVYKKQEYRIFGDISAVMGLLARTEGSFVMSFPKETAGELSKRMLMAADMPDDPDEDMIRDCIGELANVTAGQTRGMLTDTPYSFSMTTPTVISGAGHEIQHKPGMPLLAVAFHSDAGDFAVQLCVSVASDGT